MFENSVHFQHPGQKPAISSSASQYDSLIIPAQYEVTKSESLSGLLNRLMQEDGIDFYIDPQLPRYRRGSDFRKDTGDLTEWNQNISEYYGDPISRLLSEQKNIEYTDLDDADQYEVIKQGCDLQTEFLDSGSVQNPLSRYYEAAGMEKIELVPRAVIPWYIKIENISDISTNEEIIKRAKDYVDMPVKPCLFIEKSFIQMEGRRQLLIDMVENIDVSELFLWIEGVDSTETVPRTYMAIIELVDQISNIGTRPHMFYGSYFSTLLGYFGARGAGFGVFHQESKEERTGDQTGGGGDGLKRYYFNQIKEFLNVQEAASIGEEFDAELCDCPVCDLQVDQWDDIYGIGDEYLPLQRHYISVRNNQRKRIKDTSLECLIDELDDVFSTYEDKLGESDTSAEPYHLRKWKAAIEGYLSETDQEVTKFEKGAFEILG